MDQTPHPPPPHPTGPTTGSRGRGGWVPAQAQTLWQWASGVRGSLALHRTTAGDQDPADPPGAPRTAGTGQVGPGPGWVLVLSGHLTREVLDFYGHPPGRVLEQVRTLETSTVQSLDEAARALLIRVHLATRHHP